MALIAILAAIAYPSYVNQILKSKRAVAKSALLDAANRQEQFFFSNRAYTATMSSPAGLGYQTDPAYFGKDGNNLASSTGAVYKISVVTPLNDPTICDDNPCFKLQAVAMGDQTKDTACPVFTLTSSNKKTPDPASSSCW
jgi:type IV pilus assembly protein PilE